MSNKFFQASDETVDYAIAAMRDIEFHLGTGHDFDIPLLKQLLERHEDAPWMVSAEYRAYAVLGKTI